MQAVKSNYFVSLIYALLDICSEKKQTILVSPSTNYFYLLLTNLTYKVYLYVKGETNENYFTNYEMPTLQAYLETKKNRNQNLSEM